MRYNTFLFLLTYPQVCMKAEVGAELQNLRRLPCRIFFDNHCSWESVTWNRCIALEGTGNIGSRACWVSFSLSALSCVFSFVICDSTCYCQVEVLGCCARSLLMLTKWWELFPYSHMECAVSETHCKSAHLQLAINQAVKTGASCL